MIQPANERNHHEILDTTADVMRFFCLPNELRSYEDKNRIFQQTQAITS